MGIFKINNIFADEELSFINDIINNKYIPRTETGEYIPFDWEFHAGIDSNLGRLQFNLSDQFGNPNTSTNQRLSDIASEAFYSDCQLPWSLNNVLYAEYSGKYGTPNLPPHFDGETSDIIINYQFDSNTSWDIGIGTDLYKLENNSAIVFNANEHIHWRPHKTFSNDEYIKMIFFRFCTTPPTDYSHKTLSQDNEVFKDAIAIRDRLIQH
jgi:hypothetical protein